jgi:transcriptional regulator with XRE-family HTH domain
VSKLNPVDIGNRIQHARKSRYPNRRDFAEALQTSEGNVKRIESGGGLPSIDLLVRISALLEVTTDYILFGNATSTDEIERLRLLYMHMSEETRIALNNFGRELLRLETAWTKKKL